MNQAPSVARATLPEASLAGEPAHLPGTSPDGPRVSPRDPGHDRDAGAVTEADRHRESVSLRGTTRGLEILISGTPSTAALGARLTELLAEAPSFFAGSNARVAIEGVLPGGALACLEEVATRFGVQLVEIGPATARRRRLDVPPVLRPGDVPQVRLAEGTGPIAEEPVALRGESSTERGALPAPPDGATAVDITVAGPAPSAAASLAGPPSDAVSGAAASLAGPPSDAVPSDAVPSDLMPSDAVPIDAVPIDAVPIDASPSEVAFAQTMPVMVPFTVVPVAGVPVAGVPVAGVPVAAVPVAGVPVAGVPVTAVPVAGVPAVALATAAAAIAAVVPPGPRLVIGPVRSGVIVDHTGHVIVIGDVNPGAEVRAEGSIIVLGRLRGVAHAAIGREAGCIVALSLQPQQLRIGRMVARAADADRPSDGAEIAYATGETIVVERFFGRLPSGLAASM